MEGNLPELGPLTSQGPSLETGDKEDGGLSLAGGQLHLPHLLLPEAAVVGT